MHERSSDKDMLSALEINEYSWDITGNDSRWQKLKAEQCAGGRKSGTVGGAEAFKR